MILSQMENIYNVREKVETHDSTFAIKIQTDEEGKKLLNILESIESRCRSVLKILDVGSG